jgi:hypothetical protein
MVVDLRRQCGRAARLVTIVAALDRGAPEVQAGQQVV